MGGLTRQAVQELLFLRRTQGLEKRPGAHWLPALGPSVGADSMFAIKKVILVEVSEAMSWNFKSAFPEGGNVWKTFHGNALESGSKQTNKPG